MRLFIAINFSNTVKAKLCQIQNQLKAQIYTGNFTAKENLHLTLVFLGEVRGSQVGLIQNIMDDLEVQPFTCKIQDIGSFRQKGGDLWWARVEQSKMLENIRAELYHALIEEGFEPDSKRFKPHITLARQVVLKNDVDTVQFGAQEATLTEITEISLMKSERIDDRLVYSEIYRCELR